MSNYVTWGTHVYTQRELNVLVTSQHHRVQFHRRLRLLLSNKIDGETERNAEAERGTMRQTHLKQSRRLACSHLHC